MEITSDPAELDEIKRRVMQLEIEAEALKKKATRLQDPAGDVGRELADLQEEQRGLDARLEQARGHRTCRGSQAARLRRRHDIGQAQRYDYNNAAGAVRQARRTGAWAGGCRGAVERDAARDAPQGGGRRGRGGGGRRQLDAYQCRSCSKATSKLLKMDERLHERVVGKDEAVQAVAGTVRRAGLQDPNRPIGSFISWGRPASARPSWPALAEFLFDDDNAMIRIDMSEYQERHTESAA